MRMYPEFLPGRVVRGSGPRRHLTEPKPQPLYLRQRFAIFGGIAPVQPAWRRQGNPVFQLDNVHSVLRLNYETLRGLISWAPPSVAKPTPCATANASFLKRHPAVPNQKRTSGYWLH